MTFQRFSYVLYQLCRPFSYYFISHRDHLLYVLFIPAFLAGLTVSISFFSGLEIFLEDKGIINEINSVIVGLPGFFIAALAAVSSFNKPEIDKEFDPPLYFYARYADDEEKIETPISRRRLLCMLFSNLTAVSLLLLIFSKIFLKIDLKDDEAVFLPLLGVFLYFFVVWQMLVSTFLGLFYMGEKMHNVS